MSATPLPLSALRSAGTRPARTPIAARPVTLGRSSRRRIAGDGVVAWACGSLVALLYGLVGLHLYAGLRTGMDLTIFDQAVANLARFQAPVAPMKSIGMNLWGDHFHPAIVAFVPFYWIWPDPRSLLVAQACFVGLGTAILVRTGSRLLPGRWGPAAGVAVGLSFAASSGVQFALTFDVHEVAVGVPVLALAMSALVERRHRAAIVWSLLLLTVKEDASFLVAGVALVLFLRGRRATGVGLLAAAVAWTLLATRVIVPALNPGHVWPYAGTMGSPSQMRHQALTALLTPGSFTVTLCTLLACTGFLAVRSPLVLVGLPQVIVRACSQNATYWGSPFHYNLLLAVVLGFAALDGLRRTRMRRAWVIVLLALAALMANAGPAKHWLSAPPSPHLAAVDAATAQVPVGAPVATDVYLTSHFAAQHAITQQLRPGNFTDDRGLPVTDPWLVLDTGSDSYSGGSVWVPQAVRYFEGRGYHITWQEDGVIVMTGGQHT